MKFPHNKLWKQYEFSKDVTKQKWDDEIIWFNPRHMAQKHTMGLHGM